MRTSGTVLVLAAICFGAPATAEAQSKPSVRWSPAHSSNYSRRNSRTIRKIVIHTIEGAAGAGESWFRNRRANVSAHYIVGHSGSLIQMVQDRDVAWHVRNHNSDSIGIENEGYAQRNNWTRAQYRSLARLVAYLCRQYRIPATRSGIKSHAQLDPSRRSDPGPHFKWSEFLREVNDLLGGRAPRATTPASRPSLPSNGPAVAGRGVSITASSLNVRTGPYSTILGAAPRGARYVLTGRTSQKWAEIYFRGRNAWIHSDYVRSVQGTGYEIVASALNVRTGASTRYRVQGTVRRGQRYASASQSGNWRRLWYDQRAGWVHGRYVRSVTLR